MTSFQDLRAQMMQDPRYREALEDARALSDLRANLVKVRETMGLKQTEVAKRMGVSQSTVSEFENSANDPRISTLQRYARAVCARLETRVQLPAHSAWDRAGALNWATHKDSTGAGDLPKGALQAANETKPSHVAATWVAGNAKRSDFAMAA